MSTPNPQAAREQARRVDGKFGTQAHGESGVTLGEGRPNPNWDGAPTSQPGTGEAPATTNAFWNGLGRVVNFGLDKRPATTAGEKAELVSRGGAIAGSAAMAGGVALSAPAVAAAAGVVLVASSVAVLASTIINRKK